MNQSRALLASLCAAAALLAQAPPATPKPYPERLQTWAGNRFGLFVHWGPVSLKGTEISWSRANTNPRCPNQGTIPAAEYDALYKQFDPQRFDGAEWATVARGAGAKYMVLTAKHCDGFLLWHSKASDYNISATPFHRDICAELAAAVRQAGLQIGWYFSPMDWRDPDFRTERNAAFVARMQAELRELLTAYGTIDVLWFDWDGREPLYEQASTYGLVRSLQPAIVLTNRLDLGPGNNDRQILSPNADYYTPEQAVGAYDDHRPWESCMTLSRRGQWAWGGDDDGVKTFAECLDMLVRCAGGDGNLLLNVGPKPDGTIAQAQADRLRELGAWLQKNGESIYGTRGGPFKPGEFGASTRRGKNIYLHLCDWDQDPLVLPAIGARVLRAHLLGGGEVAVQQTAKGLEVSVPAAARQPVFTVVVLELDRSALELPAVDVPGPVSLTTGAMATASNVYQQNADYGPDKAIDSRSDTRWATDTGTKEAWLEVDLGQPRTFTVASFQQAYPELQRIRRFAIECLRDGTWQACATGENAAAKVRLAFAPVTAQRVRLHILEATDGPTLWEFRLFP